MNEDVWFRNGILWIGEEQEIQMVLNPKSKRDRSFRFISERRGRLIRPIFQLSISNGDGKRRLVEALFDTGSNKSCIAKEFAEKLGLGISGWGIIIENNIEVKKPFYLINIHFGNIIKYKDIQMMEIVPQSPDPFDILVGMDILGTGNFTLENLSENTRIIFETNTLEE